MKQESPVFIYGECRSKQHWERFVNFQKLQKKWYDKLKKQGFDDIEFSEHSPHLKRPDSSRVKTINASVENHYRYMRAFLEHYDWKNRPSILIEKNLKYKYLKGDKLLFSMYCDGIYYRDIRTAFNKKYKQGRDYKRIGSSKVRPLFWIFHRIKLIKEAAMIWNKLDVNGILYDYDEPYVRDILLKEPTPDASLVQ